MRFRRRSKNTTEAHFDQEREDRLVAAEKRVNVLSEKTQWIHTVVTRRDQDNHWQDSVNQLFAGGQP